MNPKKNPAPLPTLESELKAAMLRVGQQEKGFAIPEDEKLKAALADEAQKRVQHDINDARQSLLRPECRRIFYRIIEESQAFSASFVPGHADITAYNEGQRKVGIFLYNLLERAEPGICLKMAREADSDKTVQEIKTKKILEDGNAD